MPYKSKEPSFDHIVARHYANTIAHACSAAFWVKHENVDYSYYENWAIQDLKKLANAMGGRVIMEDTYRERLQSTAKDISWLVTYARETNDASHFGNGNFVADALDALCDIAKGENTEASVEALMNCAKVLYDEVEEAKDH